jgi:hypothetical protein
MKEARPERDLFGARPHEYAIPEHAALSTCGSCGAAMVWVKTAKGRAMPLSVATIETRDGQRFALSHFSDCPQSREWSTKR